MSNEKKIIFYIFVIFLMINSNLISQDLYPGTPSSGYNQNYFFPTVKDQKRNIPLKNQNSLLPKSNSKFLITVNGNMRLDKAVIIRDSKIEGFKIKDQKALSQAVKNLYSTGYFKDVKIFKSKNIIYINVKESPIINQIAFEGNSEIKDDVIKEEVKLRERNVYSKDRVQADVRTIKTLYKRLGFFSTSVEPKIIKLNQNMIDLVYEIVEGKEAKIKKINFTGNKEFSDSTLSDVIFSEESRWYKFWGSGDNFDQDRLNYDKDLLKKYYFENGFIDFRILSTTSHLVSSSNNFIINFKVSEGRRYRVSKVNVESSVKDFKALTLETMLHINEGDWFNTTNVDRTIDDIIKKASELGFAFVDVRPKFFNKKNGKVDLTFAVFEGDKIYIERINVKGNFKTHEKVIRREIEFSEGDAFNLTKIKKTERNINGLALFETTNIDYNQIPKTNKTLVDVEVTEKSTGEFSVGAGYSSLDGALGNVGIKEANLFGEGKEIALTLGLSSRRSSIDLSYTEPYFLGRDLAAGIDLFNTRKNNKIYSGYKHNIIGFKLRSGYEIVDDLRHFSNYTLKRDKIHDIDPASSTFIKSQEGKSVTSMIGQGFQYDKLNDRINPTDGYRIRLDLDYYGLGGNTNHLNTEFKVSNFSRVYKGIILANFLELGYILPVKDVKINNRFFLSGDTLRGFKNSGIGPRDVPTSDALGGEQYFVLRNELHFPIGLPDELGVKGLFFGDAGTLYNTSETSSNIKDDFSIRASAGFGISWISPFGPVKIYLSKAILSESYDKNEIFRFSFGTTY